MKLFTVNFTYDGETVRGASGLTSEAVHGLNVDLPTSRWYEATGSGDPCDLLDLVVEQLAVFSDNLHVANRQLRSRREQFELFPDTFGTLAQRRSRYEPDGRRLR